MRGVALKITDLTNHVVRFFNDYLPQGSSFIFGCSGGVDSTALLHLIHDACDRMNFQCHVVYVDHGWRKESADEAQILEKQVAALGFPFFSYQLSPFPGGENLEDWSRRERLSCFSKAASSIGTDVVVLAHQADDQMEVVLKRFLEGASLTKFRGMRPVERHSGLTIMRPLLSIQREDLLTYLHTHGFLYFEDPTNKDTTFLRARMREVVFPFLRQSFGKEFGKSLLRIADESAALEEFVRQECQRKFVIDSYPGVIFATATEEPSPFLARALIDDVGRQASLACLSRQQGIDAAEAFFGRGGGIRRFYGGEGALFAEKNGLVAFSTRPLRIECCFVEATEGSISSGSWSVSWRPSIAQPRSQNCWKDLYNGEPQSMDIPDLPFTISPSSDRLLRTISKRDKKNDSMASLRPFIPAFVQAFELVADPLTEYTIPIEPGRCCYRVTIQHLSISCK